MAMAEKLERATKYRLNGVQAGSRVSECLDKYGRWELGYREGVIVRNSVTSVTVQWEEEPDFTYYTSADARYEVDRDRWHIIPPRKTSIFDVTRPSKNANSPALTGSGGDGKIDLSPPPGALITEERSMTTRSSTKTKAKPVTHKVKTTAGKPQIVPNDDELDDEVDDMPADGNLESIDEVEDEVEDTPAEDGPVERDTYTAKQVATRIGTDAKTLRKFFRSPASTIEPCGQGGRYEFDAADLPKIKAEFEKWNSTKGTRTPKAADGEKAPRKPRGSRQAPSSAVVIEEDEEILELDDDEELEPSEDELNEIDDEIDDELDD